MVIRAISQTTPQNNITHFTGTKQPKNKPTAPHTTPGYKAIPLAVIIAMSPLGANATQKTDLKPENNIELSTVPQYNQTIKILSSKKATCFGQPADINLIDKNGKKNLQFVYHTMAGDVVANTTQIAQYRYSLISDDGSIKTFFINRPLTFTDEELAQKQTSSEAIIPPEKSVKDYIEQIQKEYPDAVKTVTFMRKLSMTPNGSLINVGTKNTMKNAVAAQSYGKNIWSGNVTTETGNYKIKLYSTDDNDNNVETFTIQKEGYPELQLQNALFLKNKFFYDTEYPQTVNLGQVQLLDAENKTYRIIDTKLAGTVASLKEQLEEQKAFNKAFFTMILPSNYIVTMEGIVTKVEE